MRTNIALPVCFISLCILAALFLSGGSAGLSSETGDVTGTCFIEGTANPVGPADVSIHQINGTVNINFTTTENGGFSFLDLPPGNYELSASFEGEFESEIVLVVANQTVTADIYFKNPTPSDSIGDDDDDDDDGAMSGDEDSKGFDEGAFGIGGMGGAIICAIAGIILFVAVFVIVGILIAYNYSKISSEKMMAHETRVKIYDHISKNPGNHLRKIKRDLKLPMGVLTHHITMMEREELIKYRLDGQYKRYFPWDHKIEKKEWLSDMQNHIVKTIQEKPGISPNKLAKQLKISRNNAYYHTGQLEKMGIILIDRSGKAHKCFMKIDT